METFPIINHQKARTVNYDHFMGLLSWKSVITFWLRVSKVRNV